MCSDTSGRHTRSFPADADLGCCTVWLVVWTSRQHVLRRVTLESDFPSLKAVLSAPGQRRVLAGLVRVWDTILAASRTQIILHSSRCAVLSTHEEAVIEGLRALRHRALGGYCAAMGSILPLDAVRALQPAMQVLADAVYDLDASHRQRRMPDTIRSAEHRGGLQAVH